MLPIPTMAQQLLPQPHRLIITEWESDDIRQACEKSREALLHSLNPLSSSSITSSSEPTHHHHHELYHDLLFKLCSAEMRKLFLIDTSNMWRNEGKKRIRYVSYGHDDHKVEGRDWGSRDMMLDLGDDATSSQQQQR